MNKHNRFYIYLRNKIKRESYYTSLAVEDVLKKYNDEFSEEMEQEDNTVGK